MGWQFGGKGRGRSGRRGGGVRAARRAVTRSARRAMSSTPGPWQRSGDPLGVACKEDAGGEDLVSPLATKADRPQES